MIAGIPIKNPNISKDGLSFRVKQVERFYFWQRKYFGILSQVSGIFFLHLFKIYEEHKCPWHSYSVKITKLTKLHYVFCEIRNTDDLIMLIMLSYLPINHMLFFLLINQNLCKDNIFSANKALATFFLLIHQNLCKDNIFSANKALCYFFC